MIARRLAAALALVLLAASPARPPLAPPVKLITETPAEPVRPLAAPQLTATDLGAWLDGYMPATLRSGKIAGGQVVVVKDGAVLLKKGYGFADVARQVPMDADRTLMRIGSTSKLFTWTAVMQQVEAGRIDLDADVNRYLDFRIAPRPGGRAITMNDLMTHTGGFEEGLKDLLTTDPKMLKTTERYLKENQRPLLFPAGAVPAYSNYGTALAGYIVQRVSGEPFEAYVERHILAPLGMARTTFRQPLPPALARGMSKGYRTSDDPPVPYELVETAPAGSVAATGADMARFMLAYLAGGRGLMRPTTAKAMFTPARPPLASGFDVLAHGFFRQERNGRVEFGHGGDTIVFHTDLLLLPAEHVGLFVSFNSRGENDAVYGARERLVDLFTDRYFPALPAQTPPAIASAAGDAAALAGHYESSRRVETGFISLFYLLQQDKVIANADGTISVASIDGKRFREVRRDLWREVGGTRQLLVTTVQGRRSIIDSFNPVGVLQAVPLARNAVLVQLLAAFAVLTLLAIALSWPLAAWLRRAHGVPVEPAGRAKLARRFTHIAAVADLVYLTGWYFVVSPILSNHVEAYNDSLNPQIRTLQIAAVLPIAGAIIGVWNLAESVRTRHTWGVTLRAALAAGGLLALLWIAWMGGLIGWSLDY